MEYSYEASALEDSGNKIYRLSLAGNASVSYLVMMNDSLLVDRLRPLKTVKDLLGKTSTYSYTKGLLASKVDPASRETLVTYDSKGNVDTVSDPTGISTSFSYHYDSATATTYACVKHSSGKVEEMWYDKCGDTIRYDLNGATQFKTLKQSGRVVLETDDKGNITAKELDEYRNIKKITHPDGTVVTIEYDEIFHQPVKTTDAQGIITTFSYDAGGNLIHKVEAAGTVEERTVDCTYNELGQILTTTLDSKTYTMQYDALGNLTSVTDPLGNKVEYKNFDNAGNFREMKNPLGKSTFFDYDSLGRLLSTTDPLNNKTQFEYNGVNNMTAMENPYGKRFEYSYDTYNHVTAVKDPLGGIVKIDYDKDFNPIQTTNQTGKTSQTVYDTSGRVRTQTDASGNQIHYVYDDNTDHPVSSFQPVEIDYPTYKVKFEYDLMGRVLKQTQILEENSQVKTLNTTYAYEIGGNLKTVTDPEGRTVSYDYDSLNRVKRVTDAEGNATETTYDKRGNVVSIKDPNGGLSYFEYDDANRLQKEIRPLGQATSYERDACGNITRIYDSKGQKIEYAYDDNNRMLQARYYLIVNDATPVRTVNFTYNNVGNLVTWSDGTVSGTITYDDLQRKTGEQVNYGTFTLSYAQEYNADGTRKSFTYPNGIKIDYSYNQGGLLEGVNIPDQGMISYGTYQWNAPTGMTLPGGGKKNWSYDAQMRVKGLSSMDPGANTLVSQEFSYSDSGNLLSKNTEHGNYAYTYDKLSRLLTATNPKNPAETYSYDKLGNRMSSTSFPLAGNPSPVSFTYNLNNEITSVLPAAAGIQYSYDSNGNMAQRKLGDKTTNYLYDVENHLTQIQVKQGTSDTQYCNYYYDPFGRRLWKESFPLAGNPSSKTYYFYSDEGLIGEYSSTGVEQKTYGYNPGSAFSVIL